MSPLDGEDESAVRRKSVRVANFEPFNSSHTDDISQELALAWSLAKTRQRSELGTMAMLRTTVLNRTAANLLRQARAKKRRAANTQSLDDLGVHDQAVPVAYDRRRPNQDFRRLTAEEEVNLRLDFEQLRKSLPQDLDALCGLLMVHTIAEISRQLGIPPSTVSSQVAQIRRRFETSKFRELL